MPPAAHPAPPPDPIQDEVLANILCQRIGEGTCAQHTVADLHLPDAFLRRIADRVIRASFEERFRIVVARGPAPSPSPEPSRAPTMSAADPASPVQVWTPPPLEPAWASLPESRPPLRAFRAPTDPRAAPAIPFHPPDATAPDAHRRAAALIARDLAPRGVIPTLAAVLPILGLATGDADPRASLSLLGAVGFPVDLLACFAPSGAGSGAGSGDAAATLRHVVAALGRPDPVAALAELGFRFTQSCPGFQVAAETGEHDPDAVRLQLTRGDYFDGPGSGSNLGVVRDLIAALPDSTALILIERRHLPTFLAHARDWPAPRARPRWAVPTELRLSQWAQDNAKPGTALLPGGRALATLSPRFASRSEEAPTFLPGESLTDDLVAPLAVTPSRTHRLAQSPLLFQGGNIIAVRDPASNQRLLLVGEAEIHRNTALGLSAEQVVAAFTIEFGVDRCIVLPAASFHLDYELTLRTVGHGAGARIIAFVNDTAAASHIILGCAIGALERHRLLTRQGAAEARLRLARSDAPGLSQLVAPPVLHPTPSGPIVPEDLAPVFSVGDGDSGVGNIHRFLLALDFLLSTHPELPSLPIDPQFRAYLESFGRREADRAAIRLALQQLGWKVIPIPSTSDDKRATNYLNGLHTARAYLMPSWGGLYRPLDDAATNAFRRALDRSVAVIPINCAESQRRAGGLHCSAQLYPKPASSAGES